MNTEEEIEIGDLVRLNDDPECLIGLGLVIDKASDTKGIIDDFFGDLDFYGEKQIDDDDGKLFLHRPVYLVLWSGDKNYFSDNDTRVRPLWFFKNELKIVNKVKQ